MDVLLSVATVLLGVLLLAYLYATRHFNYWAKRGVAGPKPTPFLGNFGDVLFQRISLGDFFHNIYKASAQSPYVGFFILDKPALLIRDPEVLKNIMIKDFSHFVNHFSDTSPSADSLTARALFFLKGEAWKQMREDMSPVFTSGRLKKMFPLILECGTELDKHIVEIVGESKAVEVKELLAKSSTDVITTCAFGINSNCITNPKAQFREFGRAIFDTSVKRGFEFTTLFFLPWLSKILRLDLFPLQTTNFLREVFTETMESREKSKTKRDDVIDHLIQLKNQRKTNVEDQKKNPTETDKKINEIREKKEMGDLLSQAATFYSAGFETSASTSTFALYELAMAPEVQTKARKEVLKVMAQHDGKITYEGLQEMKYLDCVLNETLRKYPIAPFLERICIKEYIVPGTNLKIEMGTPIFISLFGLHKDPEYFPEPEKFMPERFSDGHKIRNCTYMPFGEGPRNCIGMRFALLAVKTQLANMLSHCDVRPTADTPKTLEFNHRIPMLALKDDIPLLFTRI